MYVRTYPKCLQLPLQQWFHLPHLLLRPLVKSKLYFPIFKKSAVWIPEILHWRQRSQRWGWRPRDSPEGWSVRSSQLPPIAPIFNLNKANYEYFRRKSADSRTEHDGANQRHDSPGQVDHAWPGKVVESPGENNTQLSVNHYIYSSKYVSPSQPPPQAQWVWMG